MAWHRCSPSPHLAATDQDVQDGADAPDEGYDRPDKLLQTGQVSAAEHVDQAEHERNGMQKDRQQDLDQQLHDPSIKPPPRYASVDPASSGDGDRYCRWSRRGPGQSTEWPHPLPREAKPFDDRVQQFGMAAVDRGLPGPSDKRHGSVHRCDLAERRLRFDPETPSLRQRQHGLLTAQPWTGDDSVDGTFVQAQGQFVRLVPASARQGSETIWSWPGQPATSVPLAHEVDPAHPVRSIRSLR